MKLTYRGIEYNEENRYLLTALVKARKNQIVYRGNSPRGRISPRFPLLEYIQQLFSTPDQEPTLDPISFWYDRQRVFLQDCWSLDDIERLNLAWDLTVHLERAKILKSKQKVKLKYRGVTYYK